MPLKIFQTVNFMPYYRSLLSVFSLSFIIFLMLSSCWSDPPPKVKKALEMAGENREELEKVIAHYQASGEKLKLQAAYELLQSMPYKYAYDHDFIGPHKQVLSFVDSIHQAQAPAVTDPTKFWKGSLVAPDGRTMVDDYWDNLIARHGGFSMFRLPVVADIRHIDAKLLIDNIDYAFKAWKKPWAASLSFEQFCEYILPYRNLTEPYENWRPSVFSAFKLEPEDSSMSRLEAARAIYDKASVVKNNWFSFRFYPDLAWTDLKRVKMGTCRDQSNFIAYVMRSQGIPVGTVFLSHGTEWNVLLKEDGSFLQFGPQSYPPAEGYNYYLHEWKAPNTIAAKFWRHSYTENLSLASHLPASDIPPFFRNVNLEDMTGALHDAPAKLTLTLPQSLQHNGYVFLCDHINLDQWSAVDWAKVNEGKAVFEAVGSEKIYFAALYENNQYQLIMDPVHVGRDGKTVFLKTDTTQTELIRLYRKFPRGIAESKYAKAMIGDYFEAANSPDFSDAVKIHTITGLPDKKEQAILSLEKKFRFVRYVSDSAINIAELEFWDTKGRLLKGSIIQSVREGTPNPEHAFDGDIRTNYDNPALNAWVGMAFDSPKLIHKIQYLFRNSFNTIQKGHEYELFYWQNNGWQSLGRKEASTNYLDYEAPANTMLLLKNHTEGNAGRVFFMKDGKQMWG